ncbi:MAG TPA: hypothetical protein VM597_02590 [Gemmataceae bacterium]|jgi:hypothetical protein|nr:hypothetical protein [Gemmataceae bacterium]
MRPTTLSVRPLEGREVPACIVALGGPDTLVVTGDAASDSVLITDNGTGTLVVQATGNPTQTFPGIANVFVGTGAGSDRVVYNLTRNLLAGQQRVLTVDLGTGNDSWTANLFNPRSGVGSDLLAGSSLIMGITGGDGRDQMLINAQRDVDVGVGARLKMIQFGNAGNDVIRGYYRGENDGAVAIRDFDGGSGDDIIRGLIQEDVGSTGVSAGIEHGGEGNDQMALILNTLNPPLVGEMDGGPGFDTPIATANVTKTNFP